MKELWKCVCEHHNLASMNICGMCGTRKPPQVEENKISNSNDLFIEQSIEFNNAVKLLNSLNYVVIHFDDLQEKFRIFQAEIAAKDAGIAELKKELENVYEFVNKNRGGKRFHRPELF